MTGDAGRQRGVLIAVVGPSGVGKDSLLSGAQERLPRVQFMRRTITRQADAGGESHRAVTEDEFQVLLQQQTFLFHWQAHGLSYGIPIDAENLVRHGHTAVFNGSRHALAQQRVLRPELQVIWVTADPELRATRLAARGREDVADIRNRLAIADAEIPADAVIVENNTTLEEGVRAMTDAISRLDRACRVAAI